MSGKCEDSNALIISLSLFMDGGRKHWWRGNDRPWTHVMNYHRGGLQDDKVLSHSCTHAARYLFMCPNRHWEFGQKLPLTLSHFQTRKAGNALFSLKT